MTEYNLFDLFEKYHKETKYDLMKYMNLRCPKSEDSIGYNIYTMNGKYILENNLNLHGGEIKEFIYEDTKYIFDVYKKKEDNLRRIFIKSLKSKSSEIDYDNCAQLVYESGSDKLKIESLNGNRGCIKMKAKDGKKVDKQGTMLMYAIIDWAKINKFKKIILQDESFIICETSKIKLKYLLYNGYILQTGYPWYWKFGFKYMDKESNIKLENNKKKLDKLTVSNIAFEDLLDILLSKIEIGRYIDDNLLDNAQMLKNIGLMTKIYKKHYSSENVYDFFKEMYMDCCEIMAIITPYICTSLEIEDVRVGLDLLEMREMELIL